MNVKLTEKKKMHKKSKILHGSLHIQSNLRNGPVGLHGIEYIGTHDQMGSSKDY
jgi:hypothetical protein